MGLLQGQDDGQKPLFRKWAAAQKRSGIDIVEDIVDEVRLSSSEEWILIEGTQSMALLKADSKVGAELWSALLHFKGELKGLKLVPAKGKLGFDLEIAEDLIVTWEWASEGLSRKKSSIGTVGFLEKFSLENMKPTSYSTMSTTTTSANGTKLSKGRGKSQTTTSPLKSVETRVDEGYSDEDEAGFDHALTDL